MDIKVIYEDGNEYITKDVLNYAIVAKEDIRDVLANNYEELKLTDEQFNEVCRRTSKYIDFRDDFPNISDVEWTVRDVLRDMELLKE
jgi:hypothetical protein